MKYFRSIPFLVGLALTTIFFFMLNLILVSSAYELPSGAICFDCGLPAGFPFTLYWTATIFGGEGFVWSGVVANGMFAVVVGLIVGYLFYRVWDLIRNSVKRSKFD
jgi:hypothetical protein